MEHLGGLDVSKSRVSRRSLNDVLPRVWPQLAIHPVYVPRSKGWKISDCGVIVIAAIRFSRQWNHQGHQIHDAYMRTMVLQWRSTVVYSSNVVRTMFSMWRDLSRGHVHTLYLVIYVLTLKPFHENNAECRFKSFDLEPKQVNTHRWHK